MSEHFPSHSTEQAPPRIYRGEHSVDSAPPRIYRPERNLNTISEQDGTTTELVEVVPEADESVNEAIKVSEVADLVSAAKSVASTEVNSTSNGEYIAKHRAPEATKSIESRPTPEQIQAMQVIAEAKRVEAARETHQTDEKDKSKGMTRQRVDAITTDINALVATLGRNGGQEMARIDRGVASRLDSVVNSVNILSRSELVAGLQLTDKFNDAVSAVKTVNALGLTNGEANARMRSTLKKLDLFTQYLR